MIKLIDAFKISKGRKAEDSVAVTPLRYIQIGDLRNDDEIKYAIGDSSNVLCNKNDILIAWDGANAGTVGYNLEGVIGSTLAKLTPKSDKINSEFVGRLLQSKFKYLRENCTGATIPHISRPSLENIEIPLPPLEQQKKIAAILDAADELRQKDKALIAKYDELTQALFLDMFGDTWTNPKNFVNTKLADVVKKDKIITYGIVQAGENIIDGVPYIKTGDIKHGRILINGLSKTSAEIAKSYERSKCRTGDIVISIRATVGTIAFLPKEIDGANLTQGTARISADDTIVNPLFLFHCIKSKGIQMKIDAQTKGATFREITLTRLREIEIPLPPLKLQKQFAERVKVIEEQKSIAQASAVKSEELFNSLLQKAFNGELV